MTKRAAMLALVVAFAAARLAAEERAIYRASGADARLFDQYDNNGYSLAVTSAADGSLELSVRVSDAPLASAAPFPTGRSRDASLPAAPDRDAFAIRLTEGSATQEEAVRRILLALASELTYDPDRLRRQDPPAVFASRRGYCVGFSELAVDLLRRVGISARTVQGVLACGPGCDGYDPAVGGSYHRWIEVHYPDRGYVFSDPSASVNGVDARYIAFGTRSLVKPRALAITHVSSSGELSYQPVRAGEATVRVRK